jgi:hypothetical protein
VRPRLETAAIREPGLTRWGSGACNIRQAGAGPTTRAPDRTRGMGVRERAANREASSRTSTRARIRAHGMGVRGVPPAGGVGARPPTGHDDDRNERRRARRAGTPSIEWRCRESNPGPPSLHEGFSVRSPLCLYSDPPVTRTSRCDDPSRCVVSPSAPRPGERVSPLADAGLRVGNAPGPTAPQWIRQRERSRSGGPEPGRAAY